jgi:hypothetical protein
LFFENSTGCLISQCQLWQYPGLSSDGLEIPLATFCCRDAFPKILLESLILAQDERWRRA